MAVFNVVKFRVRLGQETRFLDAHRDGKAKWPGLSRGAIIKTGDQAYCLIGEGVDANALAEGRGDDPSTASVTFWKTSVGVAALLMRYPARLCWILCRASSIPIL
jgi:hypothetical protein